VIEKQVDILIIGGGLIGATLLLALAGKGYRVLLVDAKPFNQKMDARFDARTLALSPASVRILQMLKMWSLLEKEATPIQTIYVSEQHGFGGARLQAKKNEALGYIVEIQHINRALYHCLDGNQVLAPAQLIGIDPAKGCARIVKANKQSMDITAKIIVAADGSDSVVRHLLNLKIQTKDYQQRAIVANVQLARSHHNQAYERFTSSGPLALLPMTENRMSLVWALSVDEAGKLMGTSEKDFLATLQGAFGYRLGRFLRSGERVLFPLRQMVMQDQVKWPFVFVGNAVHTLHPVAGQGFNLGLRDVAALAQCIAEGGLNEPMLQGYASMRHHDQRAIVGLTDGLIRIFTSRFPGMRLARNLGLMAIDNSHFLRKILSYYTQGFAGVTPDLVCGIDLRTQHDPNM
jgi:2-octaprenyl-6-methoxyphenol hydroxylase